MHTAYDVKASMFSVTIDGAAADRAALLDWDVRDRLGVVVTSPLGTLGAGLLVLLAISAFYDSPGRKRRMKPLYPDVFAFHRGGPWGPHSSLDVFPDHKEVMVEDDPAELLRQINNRGITHLVVPDGPRRDIVHRFKEPEAARDRIKQCFAYDPLGTVADADVEIATRDMKLLNTFDAVLDPAGTLARLSAPGVDLVPTRLAATPPEEVARSIATLSRRLAEVDPADPRYRAVRERVEAARAAGLMTERLRRITVDDALSMLG